jgi:hypothetical protein
MPHRQRNLQHIPLFDNSALEWHDVIRGGWLVWSQGETLFHYVGDMRNITRQI